MTAPVSTAAFETVYRAEYRRLLRYAGRRIGSDDAFDVAQDAFLRLLDGDLFATIENPRAYLTRIARNLSVDRARRQTRDRVISYRFLAECDSSACPDQAWRIEAMDVLRHYRQVVRAMPPKTRRIFVMHRVHRLTYKEIAAELGVCIQTVEHHMSRALALCRAAVANGDGLSASQRFGKSRFG